MVSILSLSKYVVKGAKASEVNQLLKNEIISRGITTKPFSVRNGIAIIDEGTKNFGTTKLRDFLGLDESNRLVTIKRKASYHRTPSKSDNRRLSAAWNAYVEDGITTSRNVTSIDGKITEFKNWSANDGGGNADLFYRLGFGDTGVMKNYLQGSSVRYISDPLGKRGSAFNANWNGNLIRGYYNPNLNAGYVVGLPNQSKNKGNIISQEQYNTILGKIKDLVHGFAVSRDFPNLT